MDASNPNSFNFQCDWRFGFNINPSRKGSVGYLLTFSGCGGMNLQKDIEVWNPFGTSGQRVITGSKVTCIGLIERLDYDGGETDPVRIKAYVSKGTASDIRAKLARPLSNTKLKVAWYVIDFDEEDKLWYEAAFVKSPTTGAEANIDSARGDIQMFIDIAGTRIGDTLDINVFAFEFQVVPAAEKTAMLEFATGPTRKLVKQWGESE